jgi:hypothetical protein
MDSNKSITGPKPPRHIFGFLDETGLLMTNDRLFGMGLLVPGDNRLFHKEVVKFRQRKGYNDEFKFSLVRRNSLALYKDLVNIFFESPHSRFVAFFYDKQKYKVKNGQYKKAYNSIAGRVIAETIKYSSANVSEYITVLADDVSTSDDDNFEKEVKNKIKKKLRRNALFGMCRLESHALTEIQICDVMLGTIAYAHKVSMGIIKTPMPAKIELVKHIQKHVGVDLLAENCDRKVKNGVRVRIHKDS